jgi:diguanylate cyclase (GGDEF)-like protein
MDVDDFKKRNDVHGHLVGDMLLAELAQVVKGAVRDIDLPARYGGEEFAVLLPQTDAPGARVVAERLRSTIAGHRFLEGSTVTLDPVTVSVGVACFPAESAIVEELISLADQRLYRAKREGKNRVCVQA